MSFVACPCGFRAEGFFDEANAAYRAHGCDYHPAQPDEDYEYEYEEYEGLRSWPDALVSVVLIIAVAAVCLGLCYGGGR